MITMEHGLLQACFMFHVRDVILLRFRFLLGLSHFDLVLLFDTGEGLMLFNDDIGLAALNKETSIFKLPRAIGAPKFPNENPRVAIPLNFTLVR